MARPDECMSIAPWMEVKNSCVREFQVVKVQEWIDGQE